MSKPGPHESPSVAPPAVPTPWGDSDSLRGHRLTPGPGTPPQQVAENQRKRLLAALVAAVYERGYAATRVADLAEISGVSSRSFYDLFPDKEACLMAALEEITPMALEPGLGNPSAPEWEDEARRRIEGFAAAIVAQPATAKLFLLEAFVAGRAAAEVAEAGVAQFEALLARRLEESPARAEMPAPMVTAMVGGLLELARSRLIRGEEAQLQGDIAATVELLLEYRPPLRPLRQGGRRRPPVAEVLEPHDHAERGLQALEELVAEQGYTETTMEAVAKRAGMSAKTLYANFDDREDLLLAAIDSAGAQIVAAALPAYRRGSKWPEGIRSALGAMLGLMAARPNLAQLMLVEVYAGGPVALERRAESLAPLRELLAAGPQRLAKPAVELIFGGLLALCRSRVRAGGAATLQRLAAPCTYFALAPFIGAEQATTVASGKALAHVKRARSDRAITGPQLTSEMMQILRAAQRGPATATQIAAVTELDKQKIEAQLKALSDDGVMELDPTESGAEPTYRMIHSIADTEEWSRVDPTRRRAITAEILDTVDTEIKRAVAADTFDSRLDRHLSRVALWLDEQGWSELDELFESTLDTTLEIQRRSSERHHTKEPPRIDARALFMLFEMPEA